jgi:hypothetical protein
VRIPGFPLDRPKDQWQPGGRDASLYPLLPDVITQSGDGSATSSIAGAGVGNSFAEAVGAATETFTVAGHSPLPKLYTALGTGATPASYLWDEFRGTVAATIGFSATGGGSVVPIIVEIVGTATIGFAADAGGDQVPYGTASIRFGVAGVGQQIGGAAPVEPERNAGGYGARNEWEAAQQRRRAKSRLKARWTAEDEAELAALIQAIPDEPDPAAETRRLKALVNEFAATTQADLLTKRAQRALDFAQRAQTQLAYQIAAREIERQQQDEELAVLLALATED